MDTQKRSQHDMALELLRVLPGVSLEPLPERPKLSQLIREGARTGPQIKGSLVQYMIRNLDLKAHNAGLIEAPTEIGSCALGGAYLVATGGPPPRGLMPPGGIPLITQTMVNEALRAVLGYNPYDVQIPAVFLGHPDREWLLSATRPEMDAHFDYPQNVAYLGSAIEHMNDQQGYSREEIALVVEHLGY